MKRNFSLLSLTLILCLLLVNVGSAAPRDKLCLTSGGKIVVKRRCGKATALNNIDKLSSAVSSDCSSCGTDLSGDWSYTKMTYDNAFQYQKNITLTQTGKTFSGSNLSHTMVGNVEDKWVRLTLTVSGEEGEGYVLFAEGSLFQVGNILLGTLAVVGENLGTTSGGSIILRKNLAP